MLVVTANWAIPDGSVAAVPRRGQFCELIADVHRVAVRAGFRGDGRYRPIERLVFVLAGDTFDALLSDRWLDGIRPWERRREAATRHADVLRQAWRHARRPLAALARLARHGIPVPPAGRHGRPVAAAHVAAPVHVVILVGDRDAAVERLAGGAAAKRRGIGVGRVWDGAGLRVLHGSGCDPLAVAAEGPTLLASLTVDLLARFGAALAGRPTFAERARRIVRLLADGQPLDMPLRLRAALPLEADGAASAEWIIDSWRRSVDRWAREARRRGCDDDHGVVDAVAGWMHALDGGAPQRPVTQAVLAALSAPLPLGGGGGPQLTVVGHPAEGGGGVVCLGPRPLRRPAGLASTARRPDGVACIEAGASIRPARLAAVAVFEGDEGAGHERKWWAMCDDADLAEEQAGGLPILDAA